MAGHLHAHPYATAAVAIAAVIAIVGGAMWWRRVSQYEWTDDAFVDARSVALSSQIAGATIDVPVVNNQVVDIDAVLVCIDPRDYEAAVAQAKAQVAQAEAAIVNLDAHFGLTVVALAMWHSTSLAPEADFSYFAWTRVFQIIGLPFLLIPITSASYAGVPAQISTSLRKDGDFRGPVVPSRAWWRFSPPLFRSSPSAFVAAPRWKSS